MTTGIVETLKSRGFIKQCTDEDGLEKHLSGSPATFYVGFDPTGDSLHVGHLLPIMCMAWLQRAGHKPIVLMGGGTALVGDPSGKDKTREMITPEQITNNLAGQRPLFGKVLDLSDARIVNNAEWLCGLGYISFLRDIGKHFSVNKMIKAEAARLRLERDQGYSFIEFNYHLLQSYDFLHLATHQNCFLQVGGDDQWFHFCGGIELIRRELGKQAYAFTIPLLTTSDGKKMGKTEKGALWIDEKKVNAYDYYQYWVNVTDEDVIRFMKLFTFLPLEEIAEYASLRGSAIRDAKKKLALETTAIIHGREKAVEAAEAAKAVFAGGTDANMPTHTVDFPVSITLALAEAGACKSRGEAKRLVQSGAVKMDRGSGKDPVTDIHAEAEEPCILWAGKKKSIRLVSGS